MTLLESYLKNPTKTLPIPYWKHQKLEQPKNVKIYHEDAFKDDIRFQRVDMFFRLMHHLKKVPSPHPLVQTIDINTDKEKLAIQINASYKHEKISVDQNDLIKWLHHPVYHKDLWVKIEINNQIIASGIAEFDSNLKEGIIEWLQVHPSYQGQGYGKMILETLIYRLAQHAKFITVSGSMKNTTNPLRLYQACGFEGSDIWYICYE